MPAMRTVGSVERRRRNENHLGKENAEKASRLFIGIIARHRRRNHVMPNLPPRPEFLKNRKQSL
jgi:hypothetical protein